MKDPKRLLDGDGTAFERALLGAVAMERPSRDLHRKMRLGVGLVGLGVVAKAASASWNQLAMAGVVVVGLVTGGTIVAKRQTEASAPLVQNVTTPTPAELVAPAKTAQLEPVPSPAAEATLPEPRQPDAVRSAPRRAAKPAAVSDIREEIRLLDQARSAVRSGANGQALRTLAKYEQKFPRGQFRQEVSVLRMEALKQSGENERAAALAKRFLVEHPESPHVERVQGVGEGSK
jgi:TolA-binding protein